MRNRPSHLCSIRGHDRSLQSRCSQPGSPQLYKISIQHIAYSGCLVRIWTARMGRLRAVLCENIPLIDHQKASHYNKAIIHTNTFRGMSCWPILPHAFPSMRVILRRIVPTGLGHILAHITHHLDTKTRDKMELAQLALEDNISIMQLKTNPLGECFPSLYCLVSIMR